MGLELTVKPLLNQWIMLQGTVRSHILFSRFLLIEEELGCKFTGGAVASG